MDSSLAPQDLGHWITLLQDKQLPVPAQTLGILRRKLEAPNISLQQLQPIIAQDPVMSMHCARLANQLNRNPDTDVSTIELAVATLGLDRITQLAQQLPAIKLNSASVPHKQYFHALADSYHAATQAVTLCRYKDPAIVNKTRTAALFYGIGHWALWRYAPQQMSQIKIRIYEQQQDTALAEYEVLGCTIQQISEQLVSLWQLSRLATEALQHQTSPDAAMLKQIHLHAENSPALSEHQQQDVKQIRNATHYPVKLANWLSLSATMGWQHPKTLRIIDFISDLLQQPLDDVGHLLRQNCVKASQQHPMPELLAPAALMLLLPSELVLNYRMDAEDINKDPSKNKLQAVISPKKIVAIKKFATQQLAPKISKSLPDIPDPLASSFRDEAFYQQVLQQLTKPTPALQTLEQVLKLLQQGVIQGLGLARMICYSIDAENRLAPICHLGCDQNTPLVNFTLDLNIPSLLKKMTHKPLAVWIRTESRTRIWAELPEHFKAVCHPQSFALISLFEGNKPALMLYVDRHQPDICISDFQFKRFKQLAVAANHRIHQLKQDSH
tara:strand:+ start:65 stop:1729 length:1665 start_codon:yes stop_codon:yes gene_type:complete